MSFKTPRCSFFSPEQLYCGFLSVTIILKHVKNLAEQCIITPNDVYDHSLPGL